MMGWKEESPKLIGRHAALPIYLLKVPIPCGMFKFADIVSSQISHAENLGERRVNGSKKGNFQSHFFVRLTFNFLKLAMK